MRDSDWKSMPVFMMDFEGSASSGVVEYGVVRLAEGRIQTADTALCQPTGHIPARDRGVHGITEDRTRSLRPFADLYDRFVRYRREGLFAAHNRHAENSFMKDTWAVPPVVPDWRTGEGNSQEWGPWIDTLSVYRNLYPGLESYSLGNLVDVFQLREELDSAADRHCPPDRCKAHCALYDAIASALLLIRMEREGELQNRITLGWLLHLSHEAAPQAELF